MFDPIRVPKQIGLVVCRASISGETGPAATSRGTRRLNGGSMRLVSARHNSARWGAELDAAGIVMPRQESGDAGGLDPRGDRGCRVVPSSTNDRVIWRSSEENNRTGAG